MMKRILLFAFLALTALTAWTQTVDRAELESSAGKTIVFVNYEGPHDRIDTFETIRGLGTSLARKAEAVPFGKRAGDGKYSVVRVRDAAAKQGFDADIIILGAESGVDHIRNLRVILGGYLETAYGFERKDALLLSEFITVYNAVYRKDMKYFGSKYKEAVLKELTADTVGLSLKWNEWAGKSRIVIPISSGAAKGNISAVDTTSITDKPVIDKLKATEPDKGIDTRKDMTEFKEKEVDVAKKDVEARKEAIAADEKKIADEKAKIAEDKKALEAEKKAAETGTDAAKADGTAASGTAGDKQDATVTEREASIAKREEDVKKQEAETAKAKEDVAKKEEAVKAKEEEIKSDRAGIASDQKETIKAETGAVGGPENAKAEKPFGLLKAEGTDSQYSSIVVIDLVSGKRLKASVINSIRGRTLIDSGDSYVAVAGATGGTRAVKLVRIGKDKLDITGESADELFEDAVIWKSGDSFYSVVADKAGWAVGRFDASFALKAKSAVTVHPYTSFNPVEEGILVQTKTGFAILDKDTLKPVKELQ